MYQQANCFKSFWVKMLESGIYENNYTQLILCAEKKGVGKLEITWFAGRVGGSREWSSGEGKNSTMHTTW